MPNPEMRAKIKNGQGFIAALDQSGGSTPKALRLYGIEEDQYSGEDEMFGKIHEMRSRIVMSPAFTGERVVGAILFEKTMDGEIGGRASGDYLWNAKGVVPFIKVDVGLADAEDDMQLMKDIPGLDALLDRSVEKGMFGTKMRSVIGAAKPEGVARVVAQQFEIGHQILAKGLVPIIEPEVTITISDKAEAEDLLLAAILEQLETVPDGQEIMLKLSLPSKANQYKALVDHPKVLKVVALSGGYSRDEANALLAANTGVIASFSRALTEGLSVSQSEGEFNGMLEGTIQSIYEASIAG